MFHLIHCYYIHLSYVLLYNKVGMDIFQLKVWSSKEFLLYVATVLYLLYKKLKGKVFILYCNNQNKSPWHKYFMHIPAPLYLSLQSFALALQYFFRA